MKRVRYKPRWQSLSSTLRMMVLMTLAGGLIVGCADKPTYEVDFDQSFLLLNTKPIAGMTTTITPERVSIAATTVVISESAIRQVKS